MNRKTVYNFIDAINKQNVDMICSLMTDDHRFIDSYGNEAIGREGMRKGWMGYFQLFPDYRVEVTDIFVDGDSVAAFGYASGTFKGLDSTDENHWRLPAAWKAIVSDGKIGLWQVYADSKIPFDIIAKNNRINL